MGVIQSFRSVGRMGRPVRDERSLPTSIDLAYDHYGNAVQPRSEVSFDEFASFERAENDMAARYVWIRIVA